jgi:hypothetical protein
VTTPEIIWRLLPKPGGLKELHKIHRTLPTPTHDSYSEDFLQMEDFSPVLDEQNSGTIFDNFKVN